MLDINLLRKDIDTVTKKLSTRGIKIDFTEFNQLEERRKHSQKITEDLQHQRNQRSKEIGQAKARGENIEKMLAETTEIANKLKQQEAELALIQEQLQNFLYSIPNLPHESVAIGSGPEQNKVMREWGTPKKFSFPVKDHVELGEISKEMDFAAAAKISGARFVVLKNQIAKLNRVLIQFMLNLHINQHGYQEIYVPYIVNQNSLYGTGQLPKFAEDQFAIKGEQNYFLIPTAEVPVTNTVADEILTEAQLPLRYVCHTPCFRSEAGSYGRDTRGMIRNHQFEKVELVQIVKPEQSYQILEELTQHAEKVLQLLELPYRVMLLCTGDTGFSAAKTYDLEVWMPSQNCYREISSCSNFEAFQARRMKARYRDHVTKKTEFVHTLNGSGLAVGRTLVAILENNQTEDGNVIIPKVLREYFGGKELLFD